MKRVHGLTPIERIERARTVTESGCWETPFIPSKVYPSVKVDNHHLLVHRLSYEHYVGPIPDGALVCHRCDNPRCHNPAHLFLGSHLDNARDMIAKGRYVRRPESPHTAAVLDLADSLTQAEIAITLGISQPAVSAILRKHGKSRGKGTTFGKTLKGSAHGRALVDESQVRLIRADGRKLADIAADYGISVSTVQAIKARRTWAHLPDE